MSAIVDQDIAPTAIRPARVCIGVQSFAILAISERIAVLAVGAIRIDGGAALPVDTSVGFLDNDDALDISKRDWIDRKRP
jgi:hypothetical protein